MMPPWLIWSPQISHFLNPHVTDAGSYAFIVKSNPFSHKYSSLHFWACCIGDRSRYRGVFPEMVFPSGVPLCVQGLQDAIIIQGLCLKRERTD